MGEAAQEGRASNSNRKFYSRRLTSLSGGYCFIKNPIIEKSMRRSTGTRRRRAKKVMGKKEKKEEKEKKEVLVRAGGNR